MLSPRTGALVLLAIGGLAYSGCGHGDSASAKVRTPPTVTPSDPAEKAYDELHAAAFQVSQALESLNAAIDALSPLGKSESGETKDALESVQTALADAGRTVEPYAESPELNDIRQSPSTATKKQKEGVEDLNHAATQINNAQATLDELIGSGPPDAIKRALEEANDSGDDAVQSLSEAVRQLGGTPVQNSGDGGKD